jgi:hypothetical protein
MIDIAHYQGKKVSIATKVRLVAPTMMNTLFFRSVSLRFCGMYMLDKLVLEIFDGRHGKEKNPHKE